MTQEAARTDDTSDDLPRVVRVAGEILAPVGVITGLLYFFGVKHAAFFFGYFGIDVTTLGLSTPDYLLLAQDAIFLPLLGVAVVVLVAAWLRASGLLAVHDGRPALAILAAGAVLAVFGLVQAIRPGLGLAPWIPSWWAPVSLAVGVLLVSWVLRVRRARRWHASGARLPSVATRLTEWGAVFAVVSAAAFWAVADYSASVGVARAQQFVRELPTSPGVVVRSAEDLVIVGPGVEARRCPQATDGFDYRYDGLVLVRQAGERYVLVPRHWADGQVAFTVPVTTSVRIDHLPPQPDGVDRVAPQGPGGC